MHFADNTPAVFAPSWPINVAVQSESRDKAQSGLALAFPGPSRTDPARYAAEVMTAVASGLGGRFFEELRDRQSLAYTVQVHALARRHAGVIIAYIGTSPDKEEAARAGLLREFGKLRNGDVTDQELRRARNYLIGTHAIARQSGASLLGEIIDAWLLGEGLAELDDYAERIRNVSAADIRAVSDAAFDETRRVEGVVRGVGKTAGI
jgi:zinc protease